MSRKSIPDAMTKDKILEIKNVKNLSNSKQLKMQVENAVKTMREYNLIVSPQTYVSRPLRREVLDAGGNIYQFVNGQLRPLTL